MVRSLLLTLTGAAAASFPHPKKPAFLTIDFVVNFIDGLTNDQHDLQTCILYNLQPISDLITAETNTKKAIHDRSFTEFVKAFDALDAFLHDVQPAYAGCARPVKDAKADIAVLKNFSTIKDLMQHVKDDFAKDDEDKIFAAFEDAFRAYFQKDYGTFGADLGAALYRMMISPKYPDELATTTQAPTEPPSDVCAAGIGAGFCDIDHPTVHKGACQNGKTSDGIQCLSPEIYDDYVCPSGLSKCRFQKQELASGFPHAQKPPFMTIDFMVNFLDGLTNDNHDLQTCILGSLQPIADAMSAATDGKAAIHDKSLTEFISAIRDVQSLLRDLPPAMQTCKAPVADAKLDLGELADVKSFGDLIRHIEADFSADQQSQILPEFEAAFQAYFKKDYGSFGTDLGTALYRMLISTKYPDEKAVVV
jgi:hypothetical protein